MNNIYNQPIVGEVALGIKTIYDSIKFIFKKPALLAFPMISIVLTFAVTLGAVPIGFILYWLIDAEYIKLPIFYDSSTSNFIIKNTLNNSQNIWQIISENFLGLGALIAFLLIAFFLLTIIFYFNFWALTGLAYFIKKTNENIETSVAKSLSFADSKSKNIFQLARLLSILNMIFLISFILYHQSVNQELIKNLMYYYQIVISIICFFLVPLIAFKSFSLINLFKENFKLMCKKPFAITTIFLILFGIDFVITKIMNFPINFFIPILPIAQALLYLDITKKS